MAFYSLLLLLALAWLRGLLPVRFVLGLRCGSRYNGTMIVTCPACDAQYLLPDESISQKGRRVKCTTCDYTWLQMPEVMLAPEEAPIAQEDSFSNMLANASAAAEDFTAYSERQIITPVIREVSPKVKILMASALMTVLMVLVTLGMAIAMRQNIVRQYPPSALLFEKAGFPVETPGKNVELSAVKAKIIKDDKGLDVLNVTGTLSNNSKQSLSLPRLIVRMNGKNGWLKDWNDKLYGKALVAGKSIDFDYKLDKVPEGGENVTVLFAD